MSIGNVIKNILKLRKDEEYNKKNIKYKEFINDNRLKLDILNEDIIKYYATIPLDKLSDVKSYTLTEFNGVELKDDQDLCYNLKRYLANEEDMLVIPNIKDSIIHKLYVSVLDYDC